jgi:D-amino-acid dehydrogenase
VFYSTAKSFERAARQKDLQAALGSHQLLLSRDDCVDVEPALKACAARITGGVYTPSEEVGDCRMLCEELYRVLRGPRFNVTFRLGFELRRIYRGTGRIYGVASDQETVEGDLYVVCAGSGSRAIAANVGIPLVMVPIRGYSISTAIRHPAAAPDKSITDFENKVVYALVGKMLRTAGFAEVGTAFDGSKVASLVKAVRDLFPGACSFDRIWPWSGLRPATPTGLPVVGRAGFSNLMMNIGHGALGFTLASGSGKLIADLVAGRHVLTHAKSLAPAEGAFKGQVHVGAQWADA